jgi:hypothetical protein
MENSRIVKIDPKLGSGLVQPVQPISQKQRFLQSDAEFARHDWSIYISNLPQRAGVPLGSIRALVLKELVDNALDEMDRVGQPGQVTITQDAEHTYTVTDQGRGFSDSPEELAYRFSIAKAMVSSKQWRKPTRGCVGNGLRVIVGAVVSGGGRIIVKTRNQQVALRPRLDGTTNLEDVTPINWPLGSAITVEIDLSYPAYSTTLAWAELAIQLAHNSGEPFTRKPSPLWFDADHLALNMLAAIGSDRTLAWFVSQLDRCSSREVGQQITERFGKGRFCRDLNKVEAAELLRLLQSCCASPIKPKQLYPMGREAWKHEHLDDGYSCEEGFFQTGRHEPFGNIPFLVEAWAATCAAPEDVQDDADVYATHIVGFTINRSPAIVSYNCHREGRNRELSLNLGNTYLDLDVPKGAFDFAVNITAPVIHILGDNKTPTLDCFSAAIIAAVQNAIRRAARNNPPELVSKTNRQGDGNSQETVEVRKKIYLCKAFFEVLPEGIIRSREGEDGQRYQFTQRSLFYRVRELIKQLLPGAELKYKYFTDLVTDYENEHDEIELMVRDSRGVFSEPHGGKLIALGTVTVAAYQRPPWTYGSLCFLEKEDLVSILKQVGFDNRWDCFLTSSKGQAIRAVKDLIDKIGSTEEPTKFFCVHDADAAGSIISQALQCATKSRAARTVDIIDLGLYPWSAITDGLPPERAETSKHRKPVAENIKRRDRENFARGNPHNEPNWENWLQTWRVELNAMTSAQFIHWMNTQFEIHLVTKVIPPEQLAHDQVRDSILTLISTQIQGEVRTEMRAEIDELQRLVNELEARISAEADKRVTQQVAKITFPSGTEAIGAIKRWLEKTPYSHWRASISEVATQLLRNTGKSAPPKGQGKITLLTN